MSEQLYQIPHHLQSAHESAYGSGAEHQDFIRAKDFCRLCAEAIEQMIAMLTEKPKTGTD